MYNTCNWACAQSDQMIENIHPIFGIEAKTVAKISKLKLNFEAQTVYEW